MKNCAFDECSNEHFPWELPSYMWKYYGPIFRQAKSYNEFEMRAILKGYIAFDADREKDRTIQYIFRMPPYRSFIFMEAVNHRTSIDWKKAQRFRDELVKIEIDEGLRDQNGIYLE